MKKKIFAVSDIHGEYDVLIEGLQRAGYDEDNPEHLLISVGDAFDRGQQSLAVYQYLKRLSDKGKAVVLKGNHTGFFTGYLDGSIISPFNYFNNGTDETMADFLHRTSPFESWCAIDKSIKQPTTGDFANWLAEAREEINTEFPELLEWLKSRPYYYETEKFIFTHGAIDTDVEDWHQPHCARYHFVDWEALMWDDGSFFGKPINNTDKTIVIGHFGTARLRDIYNYAPPIIVPKDEDEAKNNVYNGLPNKYDILIRKDNRVIAIDGTVNLTKEMNVLIIESEELLDEPRPKMD